MKRMMKRVMLPLGEKQFDLELGKSTVIRAFGFAYAQEKMSVLSSLKGQPQQIVKELPFVIVECDPDEQEVKRHFCVVGEMAVVESTQKVLYVGSALSQMHGGTPYFLFEEVPDLLT